MKCPRTQSDCYNPDCGKTTGICAVYYNYTPHPESAPPSPVGIDEWLINESRDMIVGEKYSFAQVVSLISEYTASLPQSSTEEEKELWIGIFKIVSKHILKMSKVNDVIDELKPTYKISKR